MCLSRTAIRLLVALTAVWAILSGPLRSARLLSAPWEVQVLPADRVDPAQVELALRRLPTTATVLYVVAHPDDEDAGLLAYLSRRMGARVILFSLTRGEGGANLISSDFFDALGVLRTLEFRKACESYGIELLFSRAADYGYSKTLDEAKRTWGGFDRILGDLVRVIRREQPDILISRFRGDRRDGHGHHQAAGVISRLAFDAAADPERFRSLVAEGFRPWQIKKLYVGASRSRGDPGPLVSLDTGTFDPVLGCSYYQVGRHGYGFHRSQGISSHEGSPGPHHSTYRLARTAIPDAAPESEDSFLSGIDTSISGLGKLLGAKPGKQLTEPLLGWGAALASFDRHRQAGEYTAAFEAFPRILSLIRALRKNVDEDDPRAGTERLSRLLDRKEKEVERALSLVLGVSLDATVGGRGGSPFSRSSSTEFINPGGTVDVAVRLAVRVTDSVELIDLGLELPRDWTGEFTDGKLTSRKLKRNEPLSTTVRIRAAESEIPNHVHWYRSSIRDMYYDVTDEEWGDAALAPPPAVVVARLELGGVEFRVRRPITATLRQIGVGTSHPPLRVAPPVSVTMSTEYGVMLVGQKSYSFSVELRSQAPESITGSLGLEVPSGWSYEPERVTYDLPRSGATVPFTFELTPPGTVEAGQFRVTARAVLNGKTHERGFRTVTAPDVGRADLYHTSVQRLTILDAKVAKGVRVGYVAGSGDEVARCLGFLGVRPEMIGPNDWQSAELDGYDAILIGVRAYAVREDLRAHNAMLLDYAKKGGVVIVQYQTPEFDADFGPYPYSMGRRPEEVSEENAKVRILRPNHPLFTRPNKITERDFDGWVEQRGSKFLKSWDERYEALLECQDSDQEPQRGGMVWGRYGDGAWVYAAYSWYRQLPHGVSGAYRIIANMISLKRNLDR